MSLALVKNLTEGRANHMPAQHTGRIGVGRLSDLHPASQEIQWGRLGQGNTGRILLPEFLKYTSDITNRKVTAQEELANGRPLAIAMSGKHYLPFNSAGAYCPDWLSSLFFNRNTESTQQPLYYLIRKRMPESDEIGIKIVPLVESTLVKEYVEKNSSRVFLRGTQNENTASEGKYGNAAKYLTNMMHRAFDVSEKRRDALAFLDHLEKTAPVKASEFRYQVGDLLEHTAKPVVTLRFHDEEESSETESENDNPAGTLWLLFCKSIGTPWCCTYAISRLYANEEWMPSIDYFDALHEVGKDYLNYPKNVPESLVGPLAQRVSDQEKDQIIKSMGALIDKRFDQFLIEENYDVIVKLVSCGALPISRLERLPESFKANLLETDLGL